ncbi:nickel-dependent lactate racemase [Halanaerobium sp. Z-7514]|uniref:Nickel-dependent lactate racemase n=1 Tax=Halanaerobium polyolivorans TaxID=2886943 RepID=A0AAW4X2F9_9FIRM|nr:nickel-dependent lactate racemase [Halanaerobium polyolivorans]MCC3145919.1 nickel-dependent lactate racemase [Halanaerobium polyolivorans]
MQNIAFKYGKEKIDFNLDSARIKKIIEANYSEQQALELIAKKALAEPIASKRLSKIVNEGETAVIVISDLSRSWQKIDRFLPYIVEELQSGGIKLKDISLLCAGGSHRPHSKAEIEKLIGKELYQKLNFIAHDSTKKEDLRKVGETSYGTPVIINKNILENDRVILTGGIVFHPLAGFAGGRKSLLPGTAAYQSIMKNHSLSLAEKEGAGIKTSVDSNNLADNPVHLDMVEAAKMINVDFIFNVIPDGRGGIAAAVAGDLFAAHQKGCQITADLFGIEIKEKAELVIASCGGFPKDMNLYQISKAIINSVRVVQKDGYLLLMGQGKEGIGHPEVKDILQNYNNNLAREKLLRKSFTIARFVGYLITTKIENINFILISELEQSQLNNTGIKVVKTLDAGLEIVKNEVGELPPAYIMPDAANTLPFE